MSLSGGGGWCLTPTLMKTLKTIVMTLLFSATMTAVSYPARSSGLVVLYPNVSKPYSKIYEDIIAGITEQNTGITKSMAVDQNQPVDFYRTSLAKLAPDTIIALGKNNVSLVREMKLEVPLVAGGLTNSTVNVAGISMITDPQIIIDKLILLRGDVQNIHLVTDTANHADQFQRASDYAKVKNINFIIHRANSMQTAAGEYKKLLADVRENHAIWLCCDKAINHSSLLSEVLETAWKKKVVVFSSNPSHVKSGALFSIYPNNKKLGISLANLVKEVSAGNDEFKTLRPLRDVYTIVNDRTMRHLGISLDAAGRSQIDSIL